MQYENDTLIQFLTPIIKQKSDYISSMQINPDQIEFLSVVLDTKVCAGAVLFIMENVVHFQYSAGDEERANTGALEVLFHHVILKYQSKKYISFGSSATDSTLQINKGLSYWKESFGAKVIPQRTHKIEINSALNNLEIFQK